MSLVQRELNGARNLAGSTLNNMSEDIDKRVLRKYEIRQKLGKGVRH